MFSILDFFLKVPVNMAHLSPGAKEKAGKDTVLLLSELEMLELGLLQMAAFSFYDTAFSTSWELGS